MSVFSLDVVLSYVTVKVTVALPVASALELVILSTFVTVRVYSSSAQSKLPAAIAVSIAVCAVAVSMLRLFSLSSFTSLDSTAAVVIDAMASAIPPAVNVGGCRRRRLCALVFQCRNVMCNRYIFRLGYCLGVLVSNHKHK